MYPAIISKFLSYSAQMEIDIYQNINYFLCKNMVGRYTACLASVLTIKTFQSTTLGSQSAFLARRVLKFYALCLYLSSLRPP